MTSKRTPLEKRGNFLIIPETHQGERAAAAIPTLTLIDNAGVGVEIWDGVGRMLAADGWTIDEILDLIEGPEPVRRSVPAEVEFDAEEITRIVDEAVNRIVRERFPDLDKTTPMNRTVPEVIEFPEEIAPHLIREVLFGDGLELQRGIHDLACEKGWWDGYERDDQGRLKLTTDQVISKIALIHAELSEAVEEARKSPNYSEIYYDSEKPEGFAVELADALIRILDLCGALGIDAADIVRIKHEYNRTRPHRHGGKLA